MTQFFKRPWIAACALAAAMLAGGGYQLRTVAHAQDNLTPGMLFGPLYVGEGQHIELCASNLGEGDLTALVHFRNLTSGEVTNAEEVLVKSGGGGCAVYNGTGHVVGMARGDGRASDWVS